MSKLQLILANGFLNFRYILHLYNFILIIIIVHFSLHKSLNKVLYSLGTMECPL